MFKQFGLNQYSGFPFDQKVFSDMQSCYVNAMKVLGKLVADDYNDRFIVSGLGLTSGNYAAGGTIDSGVIYDPAIGLVYCAGGAFPANAQYKIELLASPLMHEGNVSRNTELSAVATIVSTGGSVTLANLSDKRLNNVLLTRRETFVHTNDTDLKINLVKSPRTGIITCHGEWKHIQPTVTDPERWARMVTIGTLAAKWRPLVNTVGQTAIISANGTELLLPIDNNQHPISGSGIRIDTTGVISIQARHLNVTAMPVHYFSLTYQAAQ